MRIVVTGTGKSGSWRIRGEQLGAAIGAEVLPRCEKFKGFGLAVCVKRVRPAMLEALRRAAVPWVWDVVDAYPQPEGNTWRAEQAVGWLRAELERLRPHAVVFPTAAMREDSGWRGPALVLPHHAWPKYGKRNHLRDKVSVVGYEGHVHYLGAWAGKVAEACARRGWRLEVNGDMTQCDIGLALREFAGHPARRWKSNVKLANIQALGVPALCSPEAGYVEFSRGAEVFVDGDLDRGLDGCAADEMRRRAQRVEPIRLSEVARGYREWLTALSF